MGNRIYNFLKHWEKFCKRFRKMSVNASSLFQPWIKGEIVLFSLSTQASGHEDTWQRSTVQFHALLTFNWSASPSVGLFP
jgi:hypothetical protein